MSASESLLSEGTIGNKRFKIYRITHDASDTGDDILPGAGYTYLVGSNIKSFTVSSGTYTITFVGAGGSAEYSDVMFISS